jgi:hypothetical protein
MTRASVPASLFLGKIIFERSSATTLFAIGEDDRGRPESDETLRAIFAE